MLGTCFATPAMASTYASVTKLINRYLALIEYTNDRIFYSYVTGTGASLRCDLDRCCNDGVADDFSAYFDAAVLDVVSDFERSHY